MDYHMSIGFFRVLFPWNGASFRCSPTNVLGKVLAFVGTVSCLCAPAGAELTSLKLQDYATMPMTGLTVFPSITANSAYLARLNFMADEPGGGRFFVNDLNGPLYILDKTTREATEYLNFNGRDFQSGMFEKFSYTSGFANGLITFQFDPGYNNPESLGYGKFYTVHMEQPSADGSLIPQNNAAPNTGFDNTGYTTTGTEGYPGGGNRQTVLVEWTDTNITNNSFEGTARELLRMNLAGQIHPMGDLIFNPTAEPGDADWRVMYIAIGDGGAGENFNSNSNHRTPQRLDALGGKVLRIVPDLMEHADTSTVSGNGRYRIPDDNPFVSIDNSSVQDEVFALGLRNPHRISWDVDPGDPNPATNNHIIVNDIGLHTWEEVNIIYAGENYGYAEREGNEALLSPNQTGPIPNPDTLPLRITSTQTSGTMTPKYPVIQYGHGLSGQSQTLAGDSISSGYVYRGSKIPQLYGKYLFGDITTGALYYADFEEMLEKDADNDPSTLAEIHSLDVLWDNPFDGDGEELYSTLFSSGAIRGPMHQIVRAAYDGRGGDDPNLPGGASVTGQFGRADIRLQIGDDGELYILSKSDGMIRQIVGPERVPGDYDYDGDVDEMDYIVWQDDFGTSVPVPGLGADGNEDGFVDAADYVVWRQNRADAGSGSGAVPEPAAALLAVLGGWSLILLRRRK